MGMKKAAVQKQFVPEVSTGLGQLESNDSVLSKVGKLVRQYGLYILALTAASTITSCGKEGGGGEIDVPDGQGPKISVTTLNVQDLDGEGGMNDVSFKVEVADESGVKSVEVLVDGQPVSSNVNNVYQVHNLGDGVHELAVAAYDKLGNHSSATKEFDIEPPTPEVSYNLEVEPAEVMPPNEETGNVEIVKIPFTAEEVITTGSKVESKPAAKVDVSLSGPDADRLEVKVVDGKIVVSVKEGQGKDHEDENGRDVEEGAEYNVTVKVAVQDKDGNVVAEKDVDVKVENKDTADYVPEVNKQDMTIDGKPILVEDENGKLRKDYVDGEQVWNPENEAAMNTVGIKNVIKGGEKLFKRHLTENGFTYPEFKDGPHKGKLVDSRVLESLSYAMGEVLDNYPTLGSEYIEPMQKLMGQILAELPPEAWEFSAKNDKLGLTAMKLKDEVAAKVAGSLANETFKNYNPEDYN